MARLLAMVDGGVVKAVIVAKLDRLTRSVKDLCELLERFECRGVALVSVAESLDTGSAAGRLVLNIMAAVSQWEREAIGERTRDALRHKAKPGRACGQLRVRLPSRGRRAALGTGSARAGGASGDSESAPPRSHAPRHRGDPQQPGAPHAPRDRVAAGIGCQGDKAECPAARKNRLKPVFGAPAPGRLLLRSRLPGANTRPRLRR